MHLQDLLFPTSEPSAKVQWGKISLTETAQGGRQQAPLDCKAVLEMELMSKDELQARIVESMWK